MARRRITQVTPMTQTCRVNQQTSTAAGMFHKNWDREAGAGQALVRLDRRVSEGQKKTPLGAGKLTKGR